MGRIVVGTDGSKSACAAVAWAAREAALRGDELHVIHAWTPGLAAYPSPWYTPSDVGVEASFEASQTIAARICETAREQATAAAPGVNVRCETIEGGSTQVLLEQSQGRRAARRGRARARRLHRARARLGQRSVRPPRAHPGRGRARAAAVRSSS